MLKTYGRYGLANPTPDKSILSSSHTHPCREQRLMGDGVATMCASGLRPMYAFSSCLERQPPHCKKGINRRDIACYVGVCR